MRPLHAIPLLALLGTIDLTAARPAHAAGWRNSGTGVVEGAAPPIPGADETAVRWKTRTQAWSNASPVAFGDMVCITEEPATLACFDADSGARRWDAESLYPHTLQGEERQRKEALLADLDQQAARLGELRIELTRMQRQLRQSPSSGLTQQDLDRHLQQMNDIEARLAEHEDLRMAKDMGVIGYATPTPAVSGDGIFAVFGNGVLSRFDPTGQRVWSIWLGEPHPFMEGFDFGTTASPVVSDGVLLVAAKHLFGIDPRSGEVLWRGPEYPHYGAPTVAHVGERAVVATPAGELLDLETGASLGGNMGLIRFVGPVAVDDVIYTVGTWPLNAANQGVRGRAYRLSEKPGGGITATMLWEQHLSMPVAYSTPLVAKGRIWMVGKQGELEVLDADSGKPVAALTTPFSTDTGTPSPTLGGGRVILGSHIGSLRAYSFTDAPRMLGEMTLEPHLGTPLLWGERIYVRGFDHLYCIE